MSRQLQVTKTLLGRIPGPGLAGHYSEQPQRAGQVHSGSPQGAGGVSAEGGADAMSCEAGQEITPLYSDCDASHIAAQGVRNEHIDLAWNVRSANDSSCCSHKSAAPSNTARNTLEGLVCLAPRITRRRQEGVAEAHSMAVVQRCAVVSGDPRHERVLMRRSLQFVAVILAGFAMGFLLVSAYRCGSNWIQGGSADPRCVYGWKGYAEIHQLDFPHGDRVSCEYRPELKP